MKNKMMITRKGNFDILALKNWDIKTIKKTSLGVCTLVNVVKK